MNCKTAILDESFGQSLAAVSPQIALQLQTLISQAIAPLMERIADLEATNAALVDRLAALEGLSAPPAGIEAEEVQSPQEATPPPDPAISEDMIQLRGDMEDYNEARASEIAQDRQRIAVLEYPPTEEKDNLTSKTLDHLQDIRALLQRADFHRSTVKDLAARLGLTKRRAWQIVHQMEGDGLVNLVWDPHHKGRKLVEVRRQIGTRSEM